MTLDDDLILWQIDLLRHDAWLRKELHAKLTKTQQEALAVLLQSANLSGAQLRGMRNIIQQGYNAAGKWLSTSLEALMPVAGDAVADIYAAHTGEVFPVPDPLHTAAGGRRKRGRMDDAGGQQTGLHPEPPRQKRGIQHRHERGNTGSTCQG